MKLVIPPELRWLLDSAPKHPQAKAARLSQLHFGSQISFFHGKLWASGKIARLEKNEFGDWCLVIYVEQHRHSSSFSFGEPESVKLTECGLEPCKKHDGELYWPEYAYVVRHTFLGSLIARLKRAWSPTPQHCT